MTATGPQRSQKETMRLAETHLPVLDPAEATASAPDGPPVPTRPDVPAADPAARAAWMQYIGQDEDTRQAEFHRHLVSKSPPPPAALEEDAEPGAATNDAATTAE